MKNSLFHRIKQCELCKSHLPNPPNPVLSFSENSVVAIIGQAPGSVVDNTGIPWDDKSGIRLRNWLGVNEKEFYNSGNFALIPMGFCYPGKGKSGDLPPRPECAPEWHDSIFSTCKNIKLKILIGTYAQSYYLENTKSTLTETVQCFEDYLPDFFVLPHPSPRNNIWMKKNEWFERVVIPELQKRIKDLI